MRIVYTKYGLDVELKENEIISIAIENTDAFVDITRDIWNQVNGNEGEVILSECEKIYPLSKRMNYIANLYSIDCNERKILGKLYKELEENVNIMYNNERAKIESELYSFVDDVISSSDYCLTSSIDLDIQGLFKLYDVKISTETENIVDMLIDYVKVVNSICKIDVFAILNLKHYLSKQQVREFYKYCMYNKIYIINIEGMQTYQLEEEKYYVIDKDLCLLEMKN